MYDLSSKFNTFYNNHVVLKGSEKTKLFNRKDINIKRLKDGLKEYNDEKSTNYKVVETVVQGSVAMSTITQNDSKDYDIDVAVIFEKDNIPDGTTATKNIIVQALKKKCSQFNTEPEFKTNCVRIVYEEGYHIDFAIYRRFKNDDDEYEYEHCGSQWTSRDPKAITQWFNDQNKDKDYQLRKIVRFSKMFCKSRNSWAMPGGLIQSVLLNECFISEDRIDVIFYKTLKALKDRLKDDKEVNNPVDESLGLLVTESDTKKINNLYNRLSIYIDKLDILFEEDCTKSQAIEAWNELFNHSYWSRLLTESASNMQKSANSIYCEDNTDVNYKDTEEFIEYLYSVDIQYRVRIECNVTQDGWRDRLLSVIIRNNEYLRPNKKLKFYISDINVPQPYNIYWKVKNRGEAAKQRDCIRGQIIKTDSHSKIERTNFKGEHYVECYIIKNSVCVAKERIDVPISV